MNASNNRQRLRQLDSRADRLAGRLAPLVIGVVLITLAAIVVVPIVLDGPSGVLRAIVNLGFQMNESGADSYAPMQDIGIGEAPEGCGATFDVPGSGTINVTPREGC